jgi:hypothetical protein
VVACPRNAMENMKVFRYKHWIFFSRTIYYSKGTDDAVGGTKEQVRSRFLF